MGLKFWFNAEFSPEVLMIFYQVPESGHTAVICFCSVACDDTGKSFPLQSVQKRKWEQTTINQSPHHEWLKRVNLNYTTTFRITFTLYRSQISEPSVVEKSVCGQYEGLRLQLHLHASVLHEAWHWPVTAGVLRPGGHLLQPHHALCQPRIPAHGGKILESAQRACQTPLHGALPGQLGLGAVRGSDRLRLLAVFRRPGRAAGQPPLLRQHPAL